MNQWEEILNMVGFQEVTEGGDPTEYDLVKELENAHMHAKLSNGAMDNRDCVAIELALRILKAQAEATFRIGESET